VTSARSLLALPIDTEERKNAYWMYPIILDTERLTVEARDFFQAVGAEGVPAGPVMWPQSYQEKCYREGRGFGRFSYPFGDPNARPEATDYTNVHCENAAWAESRTFFVPTHPTYEERDMHDLAAAIKKVGHAYAK